MDLFPYTDGWVASPLPRDKWGWGRAQDEAGTRVGGEASLSDGEEDKPIRGQLERAPPGRDPLSPHNQLEWLSEQSLSLERKKVQFLTPVEKTSLLRLFGLQSVAQPQCRGPNPPGRPRSRLC